jgi:Zn-dependent protease with chaperone function
MTGFTAAEIERSRRFHRPRHVALVLELALSAIALAALTQLRLPGGFWVGVLAFPLVVNFVLDAVRLPTSWWRRTQDVKFELSHQSTRGWLGDVVKGVAVGSVLSLLAFVPLLLLARWLPDQWAWIAAVGAAVLVFVLGYLAPVILEPVFNRFTPLADPELSSRLHALAVKAGAPVGEILVADASRRTSRQNAYVSGIGATRRVVLWDTLLRTPADEIAVVLAHELGHRVRRHVVVLTTVAMLGAATFVGVLRLVLPHPVPHDTAAILLLAFGLELAVQPFLAALSRHFERIADRFSVALTGDRRAYEALHRDLAIANLADLHPPKWLYYWFASHPTAPERLTDT